MTAQIKIEIEMIYKMTKVKLVHSAYLSARNGANTVMRSLLESKDEFAKYGIEMDSLSPDRFAPRSFEAGSADSKKNCRRARIKGWIKSVAQYCRLAADLIIYLSEMRPAKKIVKYYINSNPDKNEVAFFHTLVPCYYYLKLRKQKQHTVVVFHTNGDNLKMSRMYYKALEKSLVYKKMLRMEQYVIEHVDRIIFVAEMAKDNFLALHPEADAKKVSYIYNGVPNVEITHSSVLKEDEFEFCCVASVSIRKGQHYIVEALNSIPKEKLPKVHFTMVGDGPDRASLENQVRTYGLTEYVTFVGVSNEVDKYLSKSDVYILLSEDEGLPMAIIEAMRASLPIVSTPVGGIPEMIDHEKNGLLINPSVKAVKELLFHLNDYNWRVMGAEARKTFEEKFSIGKMIEGYAKILRS